MLHSGKAQGREWGRKVAGKGGGEGNIFTDIHGLSPL